MREGPQACAQGSALARTGLGSALVNRLCVQGSTALQVFLLFLICLFLVLCQQPVSFILQSTLGVPPSSCSQPPSSAFSPWTAGLEGHARHLAATSRDREPLQRVHGTGDTTLEGP